MKYSHTGIMILLALAMALAIASCKQEPATTTEVPQPEAASRDNSTPQNNPNLASNMSWTFLTDQMFHHRITVVSGSPDEATKKGHWMDLHDNGTYDYGVWDQKTYSGQWKYDDNTKLMELRPSGGNEKPSEWRVMYKDDNLYLAGTTTYANNAQQAHWIRMPQRPDKNAPAEGE